MIVRSIQLLLVLFIIILSSLFCFAESTTHVEVDVYKPTVTRWNKAMSNAQYTAVTYIWNTGTKDLKHKNLSRDSILMIPSSAIPDSITLIVWFHGCNGFSRKTFNNRIISQMNDVVAGGNSVAIAIPEMPWSTNTNTKCGRQGTAFSRASQLKEYIESLKLRLNRWSQHNNGVPMGTVRLVFVGHSAGGSALKAAAVEGSLCHLNPEAVVFSDASYGHWLDKTWKSCVKDAGTNLHILVRKWDKPHKNADRVIRGINRLRLTPSTDVYYQVLNRKKWTHGKIGDSVFTLTELFPPGC
tara:strand:- start:486 stop:1379 length:894 start_codon:yes stop_codon:yes gene_type:complete